MKILLTMIALLASLCSVAQDNDAVAGNTAAPQPVRIAQMMTCDPMMRNYPYALPSLLEELSAKTGIKADPQPVIIKSFETKDILKYPFIYVNFADRENWELSPEEIKNLRGYLDRGGFIFIDAGINAEFLRENKIFGQQHSFANWQVCPEVEKAFKLIYPDANFRTLKRTHDVFHCFYEGLPDSSTLPDSVREYTVNEKWPEGTYSLLGLNVKGRVAVIVSPIISMGWGKDSFGRWIGAINFRVKEGVQGLDTRLKTAAYSGTKYPVVREDGKKDMVYCQAGDIRPEWVSEAEGDWRVFRYYNSTEISDFAHVFYTRLGINIFVYAFTQ